MNSLILAGIVLIVALPFVLRGFFGRRGKVARTGFQKKDFLLSAEQRFFFTNLKQAVGEDYEIFGGIPVPEILTPRPAHPRDDVGKAWDLIADRYFDFLLCNRPDLAIVCAIVLKEQSAGRKKSSDTTDPLPTACEMAGLALVQFDAGVLYDIPEIKAAVAQAMHREPLYLMELDGRKEPRISALDKFEL